MKTISIVLDPFRIGTKTCVAATVYSASGANVTCKARKACGLGHEHVSVLTGYAEIGAVERHAKAKGWAVQTFSQEQWDARRLGTTSKTDDPGTPGRARTSHRPASATQGAGHLLVSKPPKVGCLIGSGAPGRDRAIRYEIKTATRRGIVHRVTVWPDTGRVCCSCESAQFGANPAFLHDASARVCKHVREFRAALLRDCLRARGAA